MNDYGPFLMLGMFGAFGLGFYYLVKNKQDSQVSNTSNGIDSTLLATLLNNTNKTTTVDTSNLEKTVSQLTNTVSDLQKSQTKTDSTAAWVSTANTGIQTLGTVLSAWLTSGSNQMDSKSQSSSTNNVSTSNTQNTNLGTFVCEGQTVKRIYKPELTSSATLGFSSLLDGKTVTEIKAMTTEQFKEWLNNGGGAAISALSDANRYRYNELVAK